MYAIRSYYAIIESCLTMLNSLLKENTTITKEFSTETLIIKGNSGKLHQVFLNIISNAAQSISEKGSISIVITSYSIHYTKLYDCLFRDNRFY